jgi:hypothetical protein
MSAPQARASGEPFRVVQFDGHGVMADRGAELAGPGRARCAVFEKPGGGADPCRPTRWRRSWPRLKSGGGPQHQPVRALGKAVEAAVATRLLQENAASAMDSPLRVLTPGDSTYGPVVQDNRATTAA